MSQVNRPPSSPPSGTKTVRLTKRWASSMRSCPPSRVQHITRPEGRTEVDGEELKRHGGGRETNRVEAGRLGGPGEGPGNVRNRSEATQASAPVAPRRAAGGFTAPGGCFSSERHPEKPRPGGGKHPARHTPPDAQPLPGVSRRRRGGHRPRCDRSSRTSDAAARLLRTALLGGNKLLACGNGGSDADAAHLVTEIACPLRRATATPFPAFQPRRLVRDALRRGQRLRLRAGLRPRPGRHRRPRGRAGRVHDQRQLRERARGAPGGDGPRRPLDRPARPAAGAKPSRSRTSPSASRAT